MARRNSVSRSFARGARLGYRASRGMATAAAVSSGDPSRIANRLKNKLVGRTLGASGIWRPWW